MSRTMFRSTMLRPISGSKTVLSLSMIRFLSTKEYARGDPRSTCRLPYLHSPTTPTSEDVTTSPQKRSEEHTSELQSQSNLVCRLLLEKKNVQRLWYAS